MALIQKYNSGGSFKNYVESKILSDPNSMSTKDQQNILDKLNEDTSNPELSDNKKIQKLLEDKFLLLSNISFNSLPISKHLFLNFSSPS